jgi:hypothetical protein
MDLGWYDTTGRGEVKQGRLPISGQWTFSQPQPRNMTLAVGLGPKAVENPTLVAGVEAVSMADISQSREAKVLDIENTGRCAH